MSTRTFAASLAVFALLVGQAAFAQKVVVLDFEGDKTGKLRNQVEWALRKSQKLTIVPLKKFREAAARKNVDGPRAVAVLSKPLGLSLAVDGRVSRDFQVRLIDPSGKELWKRELKLRPNGFLTGDNLRRLSKVIATAAAAGPAAGGEDTSEPAGAEAPEQDAPAAEAPPLAPAAKPEIDLASPAVVKREEAAAPTPPPIASAPEVTRDEDLDIEATRTKPARIGPKIIDVNVAYTMTWRSYCSRPGVKSCREYDALQAGTQPQGDTVDFSPQVPYGGFGLTAELYPFAFLDNLAEGIGFVGGYSRGFSSTNVRVQTPSGMTPDKLVVSVEDAISASMVYRFYFGWGDRRQPNIGFVGLRGGYALRNFTVDRNAEAPLPGSQRSGPSAGLDVAVPLGSRYVRAEGAFTYFVNAVPGQTEQAAYGKIASTRALGFDVGFAGEIWGPITWTLKAKYASYADLFDTGGTKWAQGGAAQETYLGVHGGFGARF